MVHKKSYYKKSFYNKSLYLCIIGISLILIMYCSTDVMASNGQTAVSKYALSWDGNKNVPYIYGDEPGGVAGRACKSLEEVEKKHKVGETIGVDCSAFTGFVYKHFGIDIPMQSEAQLAAAVKTFTKESEAIPGDITWWEGHVGIYIGNGKIVHTNTRRLPTNFPHVSQISGEGANYKFPSKFCRMVEDVKKLKPLSGSDASDTDDKVNGTEGYGSVITDSDLTGMPTKSSLVEAQKELELKDRSELTIDEIETLAYVNESLSKLNPVEGYHILSSAVGIGLILYSVILILAYAFDYVNVFIDISMLSIISFGKFRIVGSEDVAQGARVGWSAKRRKTYLTVSMLISRAVILAIIGIMLLSGYLNSLLAYMLGLIR